MTSAKVSIAFVLGWHICRTKLARNMFFEFRMFSQECSEITFDFRPLFSVSEKIQLNSRHASHMISLQQRASVGCEQGKMCAIFARNTSRMRYMPEKLDRKLPAFPYISFYETPQKRETRLESEIDMTFVDKFPPPLTCARACLSVVGIPWKSCIHQRFI